MSSHEMQPAKVNSNVNFTQKSHVEVHVKSQSHVKCKSNWITTKQNQAKMSQNKEEDGGNEYFFDLCEAMLAADIPLSKLGNDKFALFLSKYTGRKTPHESTLRKNYVTKVHQKVMQNIRTELGSTSNLWFSVDESPDDRKKSIIHLIVGKLDENGPTTAYLVACREIGRCNNETVARFTYDALRNLFQGEKFEERFTLAVTDAAPYMLLAIKNLQIFFPKLLHVTCLVHLLHNVSQHVIDKYRLVNKWISLIKKVFVKAPRRIEMFRDMFPNLALPPEPILIRFGTWLDAAVYHCKNFEKIKEVLYKFDDEDSVAIKQAKEICEDPDLELQLISLTSKYSFISPTITSLESSKKPLDEALSQIEEVTQKLEAARDADGIKIAKYFQGRLQKNPGFNFLKEMSQIITGNLPENYVKSAMLSKYTNTDILCMKYAPVHSMDVERSFSCFKNILTDKRHCFTQDNLEMHVVSYCNLPLLSQYTNESS
ncbi:hypothetical protein B566_EDAN013546 [Ephemera danica]|nr:hypothetical protein B566_EDAN013546 [Ephemera danica]